MGLEDRQQQDSKRVKIENVHRVFVKKKDSGTCFIMIAFEITYFLRQYMNTSQTVPNKI